MQYHNRAYLIKEGKLTNSSVKELKNITYMMYNIKYSCKIDLMNIIAKLVSIKGYNDALIYVSNKEVQVYALRQEQ